VPFLLYPQAEISNARLNSLAAEKFRYTIAVSELGA
jgi:hypothetical protein